MLTILVVVSAIMVWPAEVSEAVPMGTIFTYQGRLIDANDAADGLYDFRFSLYDVNVGGAAAANDVNVHDMDVIDGYFTVELDFGSDVFGGNAVWLEIGVRPGDLNDPNVYTALSPRQEVTPVPYALQTRGIFVDESERVGLGTTNPTEKLQVTGNMKVSGDIAYASAKTRYLGIPSAAFVCETYIIDFWINNGFISGKTAGQYVAFVAPIYLPHGANLESYSAHITDNDSTQDVTIKLNRQLASVGSAIISNSTLTTSGVPGHTTLVSPTLSETIDNATQAYLVEVSWVTPAVPDDIHLNHVNICYTINTPMP